MFTLKDKNYNKIPFQNCNYKYSKEIVIYGI